MSEIINTGTVYFPAPTNFDTLVARNTNDTLQNKTINGSQNSITNIGNSALTYSYMTINGTQRNWVTHLQSLQLDPYDDEKAQDAVAGSLTNGIHTGISFAYDDTTGRINATVTAGGGGTPSSISDGTSTLGFNSNNDLELACHNYYQNTNAAYDLGSAEYKIRHLFLSDNTIYSDSGTMRMCPASLQLANLLDDQPS